MLGFLALAVACAVVSAAPTRPSQSSGSGCCVSYGYGAMMIPCCYDYDDSLDETSCGANLLGGNKDYFEGTCEEAQAFYEGETETEVDVVAEVEIPEDCTQWYDGCNSCTVENGEIGGCTKMFCEENADAFCMAYAQKDGGKDRARQITKDIKFTKDRKPTRPQESGSGCCVSYGYGSMMIPCCFDYDDSVDETSCGSNLMGGNMEYYQGTCEEAQAFYEGETETENDGPGKDSEIPDGCTTWYDGCNTCYIQDGQVAGCTMMLCVTNTDAYCMAYGKE